MSDKTVNNDPVDPIEEEVVEAPSKKARLKSALSRIKPYAPHIATAVVSVVCGAIIFSNLTEDESDGEDFDDLDPSEVEVFEVTTSED